MLLPRTILLFALGLSAIAASELNAEQWKLKSGQLIDGKLSGVYGPLTLIDNSAQSCVIPIDLIDDDGIDRIDQFLRSEKSIPAWKRSTSAVSDGVLNHLLALKEGKFVKFDPGERTEPEFYLIYFSAHWCAPCRAYTPHLVEAYKALRANPAVSNKFELIFVSSDNTSAEQKEYVRGVEMPWPFLDYSYRGRAKIIEQWAGRGIPCLVVINREGRLLFNSFRSGEYLGPDDPLDRITELLGELDPANPTTRAARYRIAVKEQLRAGVTQDIKAKPYRISFDLKRYPTVGFAPFNATIVVDASGHVASVSDTGTLPDEIGSQFRQDAANWLFLPEMRGGHAVESSLTIPIKF